MNHVERALSRIIYQYRNSPKFKAWVSILPQIAQDSIESAAQRLINILDIDEASGEILNIIGRIVGQPRPFVDSAILVWFGWEGNAQREQWGAPWLPRGVSGTQILMPDEYYRILIKAKVAKNTSLATIDDMAASISSITGISNFTIDDSQDMTFSVIFGEELGIPERIMLTEFDILPRPQGVKFTGFVEPVGGVYFGYLGDPNSRPYGVAPYAQVS
ncbi:MAG TPA: DUF2612 domain-containing protein [Gammaproteobacteria bacterium]|nr:DUF2612 domain-containing protein [Gammaproteobacteria bacterium]